MDPRNPSLIVEQDPEEPLEAPDYYEAFPHGWLPSDADEEFGEDLNAVEPAME
ncbi:MAG: hypothetical protein ACE5IQ_08700 [Candidatus Methylomirabilales bacterium]